ncbi:hypothetical protein [Pantoea ananatis]|uniref:hypothetical protein n=1 Tax=Pantoea ananas TaxID=553 RepID=UPI0025CA046B|nr:hypothetical protein [Pantoea ananatis]MDN4127262.1 hypothetical protein [Pantoea ananatis]MDN4150933.1 hypothetical protein [Pantoea ananatis]
MSHPIYFQAISEKARELEQLCCASHNHLTKFKSLQRIYNDSELITEYEMELYDYYDWLNYAVSDKLIQICTKVRVFQDSYKEEWDEGYSPEVEAFEHFPTIAEVLEGTVNLSLRECCNKVIHALKFELIMLNSTDGISYWDGDIILSGTQAKRNWKIKVNVYKFCLSIRIYFRLFT